LFEPFRTFEDKKIDGGSVKLYVKKKVLTHDDTLKIRDADRQDVYG